MKLLGVVLQNKKGQNILISSTACLPTRTCVVYSHLIYSHILDCYRQGNRLKIQRTINLEYNLLCACNITKDYIVYVFITKTDLPLAFEAIRKVGQYFNRSGIKMQNIGKKIVQYMSTFEQFLYTRQLPLKQFLPMCPQSHSQKKPVDLQILNKFAHIVVESDKKIIQQSQLLSCRIEGNQMRRKLKSIESAQKFIIKSQDQIYLLDIDPEKEVFVNLYRRNLFKMAMGKRKGALEGRGRAGGQQVSEILDITNQYLEETVVEKERIKIKMKEKLSLLLHNDKIKQVQQLGQVIIQGSQKQSATLTLLPPSVWSNPKLLSRRTTPNSVPLSPQPLSPTSYNLTTPQSYKSKPLIDYVLKTQTFNQDKIPLLFIYTMQVNSSNIEFTFKYKLNQKWKFRIYQFDINVHLHRDFVVLDCKSIPAAYSLKGNRVTWKTKEILPGGANAKGKLLLAFSQAKFPAKNIISQIKLSMKSNCGLLQTANAQIEQDLGITTQAQKLLLIQYRILPA